MKLKITVLASALLSVATMSAHAAKELTAQQAAALKPFERIAIIDKFNSIGDANAAISRRADSMGAASYFVQGINELNSNSGNWRVTADLYKADALKRTKDKHFLTMHGVRQYPKDLAYSLEPYDTVSVNGFFRSQPDVEEAISRAAARKGAYGYFIIRQVDANNGGNQYITAFLYKKDATKRLTQDTSDMIPADSQAGKAALAAGGAAAKRVAIPGVASSDTPSNSVGRFFETQSSSGKRYTVKLPDGRSIEEVNAVTAAQMQPFDSVTFTGHFGTPTDISEEVGRRAIEKGAKYYHITRQWQNQSGGNLTVSADLFK
ncbi:Protein of unknown function [Izhakiella capsodis]|uniref:YdgH/BhsA/McbA-like domain-containing protein n=1 Tax=Izhakiella capsodis TaxID=1367852 RepID=A0A1I4V6J3_9GAMM|nr:DUF1471 family protein YdgH [Izhakiella capsodis]SFM96802.1 Protein of unknown function [Izhakiella capsodis]